MSYQPLSDSALQMRLPLVLLAAASIIASPAYAQSAPDKSKSLDALHSEALIDQAGL